MSKDVSRHFKTYISHPSIGVNTCSSFVRMCVCVSCIDVIWCTMTCIRSIYYIHAHCLHTKLCLCAYEHIIQYLYTLWAIDWSLYSSAKCRLLWTSRMPEELSCFYFTSLAPTGWSNWSRGCLYRLPELQTVKVEGCEWNAVTVFSRLQWS